MFSLFRITARVLPTRSTTTRTSTTGPTTTSMDFDSDSDSDDSKDDLWRKLIEQGEKKRKKKKKLLISLIAFLPSLLGDHPRDSFYVRDRMNWAEHVHELHQEGGKAFYSMYRMDYHAFQKLVNLIDSSVRKNGVMAERRTGKSCGLITTEIALHCALRWLAGGSYLDIRITARISKSSFYLYAHRCIDAINNCPDLRYKFPTTTVQLQNTADDFNRLSSHGIFEGCVGAVDGLLLRTRAPASAHVGNVRSFYSGHYKSYGHNIQAVCDSQCRFVFMAANSPGGSNDAAAYRNTTLPGYVSNLPAGKFIVGDNAYTCSENLLTPFSGGARINKKHDVYNFYLSQMRIRIECTFGRCVNKWRLFKSPLNVHTKNVGKLFYSATLLHNFCINEGDIGEPFDPDKDRPLPDEYYQEECVRSVKGYSRMRLLMVESIANQGLERPQQNISRNGIRG